MSRALLNPWKRRLYFITRLPSLWFWGIKVKELDNQHSVILLPFRWSTKNPFRSIYFAALCGAGELSSGLLALDACQPHNVSMLVTGMEAQFYKKATQPVQFQCSAGEQIHAAVQAAISSGNPQTCDVEVVGLMQEDTIIRLRVTWSFRARNKT